LKRAGLLNRVFGQDRHRVLTRKEAKPKGITRPTDFFIAVQIIARRQAGVGSRDKAMAEVNAFGFAVARCVLTFA
jgi:hypothetical protein